MGGGVGKHEEDGTPLLSEAMTLLAALDATYGMGVCECGTPGLITIAMRDEEVQCVQCCENAEQYKRDEMGEAA